MSKEKIDEIAKILCQNGFCNLEDWNGCKLRVEEYCSACIRMAERLYNAGYRKQSGVTDINVGDKVEWISVEERLPEKSGDYLTYHNGVFSTLMYSAKHRLFNATDLLPEEFCLKHNVKVSHWMPLPEAPKMRKEDEGK